MCSNIVVSSEIVSVCNEIMRFGGLLHLAIIWLIFALFSPFLLPIWIPTEPEAQPHCHLNGSIWLCDARDWLHIYL